MDALQLEYDPEYPRDPERWTLDRARVKHTTSGGRYVAANLPHFYKENGVWCVSISYRDGYRGKLVKWRWELARSHVQLLNAGDA